MASAGDLQGLEVSAEPNVADVTGALDGIRTATENAGVVRKVERRASLEGRPANNASSYLDYTSAGYYEQFAKPEALQHVDSTGNLVSAGETAFPAAGLQTVKPPAPAPQPDRGENDDSVDNGPVAAASTTGATATATEMETEEKDGYKPSSYFTVAGKTSHSGMNNSNSLADLGGAEA